MFTLYNLHTEEEQGMKDRWRLNKLYRKNRKIEKPLSKVSVSKTEAENLCEYWNIVKKY